MAYAISHLIPSSSHENQGGADSVQSWGSTTDLVIFTLLLLTSIVVTGDQSSNWVVIDSTFGGCAAGLILIDFGTFLISREQSPKHDSSKEMKDEVKDLIEFCEKKYLEVTGKTLNTGLRETLTRYFIEPEKEYDINFLNDLLTRTYDRFLYMLATEREHKLQELIDDNAILFAGKKPRMSHDDEYLYMTCGREIDSVGQIQLLTQAGCSFDMIAQLLQSIKRDEELGSKILSLRIPRNALFCVDDSEELEVNIVVYTNEGSTNQIEKKLLDLLVANF